MPARGTIVLGLMAAWTVSVSCQTDRNGPSGIVLPGAVLERVFDGAEFTEGPAVAPNGKVYFSDLTFGGKGKKQEDGHIWRFDPGEGLCTVFRSPSSMSNGIEFDASGAMIVAEGHVDGNGRIIRTDMQSGKSEVLAGFFEGRPFNSPNDIAVDRKGRIYFTDPHYGDETHLPQPVFGVYRLDPTGRVTLLIGTIRMPNGIAISPDQSKLYVGCFDDRDGDTNVQRGCRPEKMAILEYALGLDGSVQFSRVFVDYGVKGGPDGLAVDREGNLYAALRDEDRPRVVAYSPEGKLVGFVPVPEIPSNVAFDRPPHDNRLYITAGGSLYRITLTKRGYSLPREKQGRHPHE